VHGFGFAGNIAQRIDEAVKLAPGRDAVDEFDAADFDQAVDLAGLEAGRFRVEHDFAQHSGAFGFEGSDANAQIAKCRLVLVQDGRQYRS
jgi:hypothetical protein